MKRIVIVPLILPLLVVMICLAAPAQAAEGSEGEQAFIKHCAVCHPGGKNIINPAKTLSKKVLSRKRHPERRRYRGADEEPRSGDEQFDEKTIPGKTAKAIAEYILKTFQ